MQQLIEYEGRDLLEQIRQQAILTQEECDNYTVFFMCCGQGQMHPSSQEFEQYKNELTFLRQYISYIMSLQEDVEISENNKETNQTKYQKEKVDLTQLLSNKSSAPKEQVYPKFATLAQSYIQLLEEKANALNRLELFRLLLDFKNAFKLTLPKNLINQAKNMYQDEQDQVNILYDESHEQNGIERLLPQNTPDFMQTPLDYLGFCVYSIVERNGLLVPGKPSLGVYRYKEKNCVFSNESAINSFLQ